MLVWLAEYLVRYETAFNAISYITVRAILALLTALFISTVFHLQGNFYVFSCLELCC